MGLSPRTLVPVAAACIAALAAISCGEATEDVLAVEVGHGADATFDAGGSDASDRSDLSEPSDVGLDDAGENDAGSPFADAAAADAPAADDASGLTDVSDASDWPDAGIPDASRPDTGPDDAGPADAGQADTFCRSWNDCAGDKVCDFSLGRCEQRDVKPADAPAIYNFKPPAGGAKDVLVIDGGRFYKSLLGMFQVKAKIGSVSKSTAGVDENRILVHVAAGDTGVVSITAEGGQTVAGNKFVPAPDGIIPCDGKTPEASGSPGLSLSDSGPYAAGYVDDPLANIRIHYPSECGSLRRPPVKGTWPLVTLLHGNGAGYLNYEYLGQFLATWGFVTVMPEEAEESGNVKLQQFVLGFFDKDLGAIAPVLSGLKTMDKIAHVGHSRGTGRLEDITHTGVFSTNTVASVFLGPVDNGMEVPSGMFMVFHATGDGQSTEGKADETFNRQLPPKWKVVINGGNHSLYSDHKVWLGPLSDELPTITRTQQFRIVTSFVLPLFERAFGVTEHFPSQLDNPPQSAEYSVKMQK
ncbi:MAG: hypothetical protein HY897_20875 [Deltaproteobacteria bacterium]|nr:hypothetical protein [Deltaproteobacteria bacterium]